MKSDLKPHIKSCWSIFYVFIYIYFFFRSKIYLTKILTKTIDIQKNFMEFKNLQ